MGCPETLITDQGREFVNELSSELYQITNTDHRGNTIHRFVLFLFGLAEILTIMKYLLIHRAMDWRTASTKHFQATILRL